nr:hypothetical protein [Tanacetum cinerariifolium]
MASTSPICLMARVTPTKSWLWHQRLSYLNFDTINDLAKNDLIFSLPKFKYAKGHLCPSCEQGKSKRASHPPKPVLNSKQRLHLLHMGLCGPMRVASINGKQYVLIIVDDYSRYTWEYFDSSGLTHETSAAKTPQQNEVVERRNRTLVKAARTMLIFSHAPLFLWAEAIATACYTQNRSIIHRHFNKTLYELIQGRKPDNSYLYVFGALCYPKNDHEDIGKLGAKGNIGFFIGYSANSVAYIVYNRRTKKIMKTMNVTFDELSAMAFEQNSSRPGLQSTTSGQISFELELTYAPSTITPQIPSERDLDILFLPLHNEYLGGRPSEAPKAIHAAPVLQNLQAPTASMSLQDSTPAPLNSSNTPVSSNNVDAPSQQHAQRQRNLTPSPTASTADNVSNAVIQQYLQNEHYALWEVIEFGDCYKAPQEVSGTSSASEGSAKKKRRIVAVTTEDMQKRRNDVKARTTLLLALPDEHQLRFSKYKTAQELQGAILKTFGGNEATKKTKNNQLKQQYGNFKAEGSETLEQTFNRLQAIVSHLEFIDVEIEQDNLNQKFLTSLAPEWLMYTIVWRNRGDLDTMSLDDLYNHLKVYEPEVQKKSESNSQNMAFISSAKKSSGKGEVNTASIPTVSTHVPTVTLRNY